MGLFHLTLEFFDGGGLIIMRNNKSVALVLSLLMLSSIGCSQKDYSVAPVSGTVIYKGNPVAKLQVIFSPKPVGDNHSVGPYSRGVTDSSGKFTLKTRYDESGAVVGGHTLSFQYSDISETAMSDLRADISDAKDSGSKEDFEATKKKIAELTARLKGRPVLEGYDKVVDVPSGGHKDLIIDLTEMESE